MFRNILDFTGIFADERRCIAHLHSIRWKDGVICPYCDRGNVYTFRDEQTYKCALCAKRFSVRVGTIFQNSKIPLRKWFAAIYLMITHKKGLASTQLARDLGVTQKTAWFMLQRIRAAMASHDKRLLKGIVEVDETYIGGKEKNKHWSKRVRGTQGRSTKVKAAVVGLLERRGKLRLIHVPDVKGPTVRKVVTENVENGTRVMTDEYKGYKALKSGYVHEFVNHAAKEYGRADVTTNAIEGVFSLLKRGLLGIYHKSTKKHLHRYLAEFEFRYNTRNLKQVDRFDLFLGQCERRLNYAELIA